MPTQPGPAARGSLSLLVDDATVHSLSASTEDSTAFASFRLTDADVDQLGGMRGEAGHRYSLEMHVRAGGDVEEGAPLLFREKVQAKASLMGLSLDMLLKKLRMLDSDGPSAQEQEEGADASGDKETKDLIAVPDDLVAHLRAVGWEEHLKVLKSANQQLAGAREELGITVTWKDLVVDQDAVVLLKRRRAPITAFSASVDTVTAPCQAMYARRGRDHVARLNSVSGVLRPGTMTLLLGPPQAGKTTLLHAIAGRMRSAGARHVSGVVRYNGYDASAVQPNAIATLVEQTDVHMASMTVKETVAFAYACRGPTVRSTDPDVVKRIANARVDLVLAVLGLSRVADTLIGNSVIKGISGGEMRRVTLAEMLVVGTKVLALDEVSTGLDSAAAADVAKSIRSLCRVFNVTSILALLQPPPEVVALFDEIILLNEGRVAYHGPQASVEAYFASLGHLAVANSRGVKMDMADYLIDLCKTDPSLPDEFAASELGRDMLVQLAKLPQDWATGSPEESLLTEASRYRKPFWQLMLVVSQRQWILVVRNLAFVRARIVQNCVMGLILGAVFFKIPFSQWYLVAMVLFNLMSFMGFASIALLNDTIAARNVFYKQSRADFFPATVYVTSDMVVGLPFTIMDAFVLCTIIYWMAGLSASGNGTVYATFLLIAITFGVSMSAAIRFFAYVSRDTNSAHGLAIMFIVIEFMFSGAIITPSAIPSYWIWIYWGLSPMAWAYRSAMQNEFYSDKYMASGSNITMYPNNPQGQCWWYCQNPPACVPPFPHVPCGTLFLQTRQVDTNPAFLWAGVGVVWGFAFAFAALSVCALTLIRYDEDTDASDLAPSAQAMAQAEVAAAAKDSEATGGAPEHASSGLQLAGNEPLVWQQVSYTIQVAAKEPAAVAPSQSTGSARGRHMERIRARTAMHPLTLIKRVSGWAKPFTMTALMGSSGAGKTTLLDVLSFRKTYGVVQGGLFLGPRPFTVAEANQVGYVEQFGQHLGKYTVKESCFFSARLRLPLSVSDEEIEGIVKHALRVLELTPIQGDLAEGLTWEETKRLTLAVELVARPRVLFADEPTSGLTSHEALLTVTAIRRVASLGVPVICTVHQPSEQVFALFDRLMLLKTGGRVVYFGPLGPGSRQMISYFEALPGVKPCPEGLNPAAWMLQAIGSGLQANAGQVPLVDFADAYEASALAQANDEEAKGLMGVAAASGGAATTPAPPVARSMYAVPIYKQFTILLQRNLTAAWRTPSYSLVRWSILTLFSVLIGTTLYSGAITEVADVQSRVGAITLLLTLGGNFNAGTVIPYEFSRRSVFARERLSRMYNPWAYSLAEQLSEDPFVFVEVFLMVVCYYPLIQLSSDAHLIFYFFFLVLFYVQYATNMSLFFISALPSVGAAQLAQTLINQIWIMFSGISIPGSNIPSWMLFLYYTSTPRWANEGLLASQFSVSEDVICYPTGTQVLTWKTNFTASMEPQCSNTTVQPTAIYLEDVRTFARCCQPVTSLPISARAMVFQGQSYPSGAYIPGYLGGPNGYREDWLVWDYVFVVGAMLLFRLLAAVALAKIQHIQR